MEWATWGFIVVDELVMLMVFLLVLKRFLVDL